jgi:aarF domain-containing kinase
MMGTALTSTCFLPTHLLPSAPGIGPVLLAHAARRYRKAATSAIASASQQSKRLQLYADRIHPNVARIYARRVLEIAAASAAVHRFVAELTAATAAAADKPADWQDWKRKEYSKELRQQLGSTTAVRLWNATKRVVSLTCLAAPFVVLYPLSLVSDRVEALSWKYALWGIEQAGPTYIKLFQWATTRQDLFSPEFCLYFGTLQDRTVGHPWRETERILKEELGDAAAQYLQLDSTPIGSGCIAQVYRGTLKQAVGQYPASTEVAIKIQHPGIWHKVCVDFYIMDLVARWFESLPALNLQYLSLVDSVRQFRDIMLPQLNLTLEAKHLARFNRDFASDEHVSFPHPITDLTSTKVLTETFVRGKPILEYVTATDQERYDLASLGLSTTLKMIFLNDFLHGESHAMNASYFFVVPCAV